MEEKNQNSEVDRVIHLIDVTSEDDSLISSHTSGIFCNQSNQDYFQLPEVGTVQVTEGAVSSSTERKLPIVLSESSQPERTRKAGKCNLRKSLAWDSAFFTSAGVLEPEELSIVNCGLKKADVHPLPRIEEDIHKSAESNSTLDSDNVTLESLEAGLFEDVRASVQISSNASILTYSSSRDLQVEPGDHCVQSCQSSRKMELASRNKMKPIIMSKRQTFNTQGIQSSKQEPESAKKEADKTRREAWGTKKESVVHPHAQVTARSGELNQSFLRPPKMGGRVNPISISSTKRDSLGANRIKTEIKNGKSTTGRREGIGGSKRPVYGDSIVTPRSKLSPNSSSSSSVTISKMESAASCSSHNRSGSTSSDATDKSPLNSLRKKTNVGLPSAIRISSKDKTEMGNSRLSAYIKSASKLSPSISPASSQDDWSSESSSSTQHSRNLVKKLGISSPFKGSSSDSVVSQSHMQKSVDHKRGLPSPSCPKRNIAGATTQTTAADVSRSSKPTGLRMPSPKFGYFDAEKSTETGGLRFHPGVRSGLPKHGAGVGGNIRVKHGVKPQPATSKNECGLQRQPLEVPKTEPIPDIASLSEDMAQLTCKTMEIATIKGVKSMVMHDLGHSEKENSGCYENQVDELSRDVGSIIEPNKTDELSGRKHTTTTSVSREVHEDDLFSTDIPRVRTPLAVKPLLCNETEDSSEFASTCTVIEGEPERQQSDADI